MSVHETVELIETREDLVAFIEQLRLDYEDHPEGWGNNDLAKYLDGLAGWTDDMAGYLRTAASTRTRSRSGGCSG